MIEAGPALEKLLAAWGVIYNRLGDPRTKNLIICCLALMSLFGVVAPETATALRDTVIGLL